MGRVKRATRKKTRSIQSNPKYVVEQPSAKLSSYHKKSSDPSHRKEDPSDRGAIDRVHSLRLYGADDSYDREARDRVHSLRFYGADDSYDREARDRVHSLRLYKTDDSYDREARDRVHSLRLYKKTSETPDFPKLSEKPPHGVISSQVNQIGTVTEVVKMAKDAQGSVVMSQTSGETNDSFTADLSVGVLKSGAPCRGERLAKYNQVFC